MLHNDDRSSQLLDHESDILWIFFRFRVKATDFAVSSVMWILLSFKWCGIPAFSRIVFVFSSSPLTCNLKFVYYGAMD